MKKLLPLIAIILFSCSKNKEDIPSNATPVTVQAFLIGKYWNITLTTLQPIKSNGTAHVSWKVYNNGNYLYDRDAVINFEFNGTQNSSPSVKTDVQGTGSMKGSSGSIIQMSGTGGFNFVNP